MNVSKVMIVDDSSVDREHLRSIVAEAGYQVVTAIDGGEALAKAKTYRPDIILMDVVMDGVDGFEACRNIRADTVTENIPIYFVTCKNQKVDRVWGELQGGSGMISKPYTSKQILDVLSAIA